MSPARQRPPRARRAPARARGAHAVVVGCGAIGSHAAASLARDGAIGRLTLVDFDTVSRGNLGTQLFLPAAVSLGKAEALAAYARGLRPGLAVEALGAAVEDVPLGRLRADVLIAAVDSRRARLALNEISWRLRVPLFDAALQRGGGPVRVNRYVPGPAAACLVCGWSEQDFALVETVYPCRGGRAGAPPTRATAAQAALAGALLAHEVVRALRDPAGALPPGGQWLLDPVSRRQFVTVGRRNPACRFDHCPLGEVGALAPAAGRGGEVGRLLAAVAGTGAVALGVVGRLAAVRFRCGRCFAEVPALGFGRGAMQLRRRCACGGRLRAGGFDLADRVALAEIPPSARGRTLAAAGLRPGDLLTLHDARGGARHVELAGGASAKGKGT